MKRLKKTATSCCKKIKKFFVTAGVAATTAICTALPASAATTIKDNVDTKTVVGGILDVVFQVAMYMGFIIAATGVFTFIMAFKDDNAESQSRGARLAVVGAILIALKPVIKLTGLIN